MRTNFIGIILLLGIFNYSTLTAQSNPDCKNPFPICEKISYHFGDLNGSGFTDDITSDLRCAPEDFKEINSHWMKFSIKESGTLTFSINPENENHDVDFILFKANDFDCSTIEEIRCMASGQSLGSGNFDDSNCLGSTGLRMNSTDKFEYFGCKVGDDNYLKYLQTVENEQYILFVNDYHKDGAISVTFEGTAELLMQNECNKMGAELDLQISKVFPNPAKKSINIEFTSIPDQEIDIEIIDMQSKVFKTLRFTSKDNVDNRNIDLDQLPSGSYLIRMKQGRRVAVKQFVKI